MSAAMTPLALRLWPDMEQRSEAWFRARAGRPTASQFHRIITPAGKDSAGWADYATELIAEALQPEHISADFYGNRHTERGEALEPEALAWAEKQLPGLRIEQAGFVTRDDETIGCSPDGLLVDAGGEFVAGIEVKSPRQEPRQIPVSQRSAGQIQASGAWLHGRYGSTILVFRQLLHPVASHDPPRRVGQLHRQGKRCP